MSDRYIEACFMDAKKVFYPLISVYAYSNLGFILRKVNIKLNKQTNKQTGKKQGNRKQIWYVTFTNLSLKLTIN